MFTGVNNVEVGLVTALAAITAGTSVATFAGPEIAALWSDITRAIGLALR